MDENQEADQSQGEDQAVAPDEQSRGKTPEARAESAQERTQELADELERLQARESDSPADTDRLSPQLTSNGGSPT